MKKKILVVDDDTSIQDLLGRYLGRAGYDVISSPDGKDALKQCVLKRPDLILIDFRMPGLDGLNALDLINLAKLGRDLPIIMMSGTATSEVIDNAKKLGAWDFLVKPFNPTELMKKLEQFLDDTNGKPTRPAPPPPRTGTSTAAPGVVPHAVPQPAPYGAPVTPPALAHATPVTPPALAHATPVTPPSPLHVAQEAIPQVAVPPAPPPIPSPMAHAVPAAHAAPIPPVAPVPPVHAAPPPVHAPPPPLPPAPHAAAHEPGIVAHVVPHLAPPPLPKAPAVRVAVDPAVLTARLSNPADALALIDEFLASSRRELLDAQLAIREKASADLKRIAGHLKTEGTRLGAVQFAVLCGELEKFDGEASAQGMALLKDLREEYKRCKVELEAVKRTLEAR